MHINCFLELHLTRVCGTFFCIIRNICEFRYLSVKPHSERLPRILSGVILVWAALYKLAHREDFFTNRVTNVWKSLPEKAINGQSIDQFKNIKIKRKGTKNVFFFSSQASKKLSNRRFVYQFCKTSQIFIY